MGSKQIPDLIKKCSCADSRRNVSQFPKIKDILPVGYEYCMCEWLQVNDQHFECRFRVNVVEKENAIMWFEKFQASSNTYYTKDKTFPGNTKSNVYKVSLKCHHNTRPKNSVRIPSLKHTKCPAHMGITVKQTTFCRNYKSRDVHLQEFPMIVIYRHKHNHSVDSAETMKYHAPNADVRDIFIQHFENGLTPSKAVDVYTTHLKEKYKNDYFKILADGSIYPDKKWVYNQYYQIFRKEYGEPSGDQMLHALHEYVKKYNTEMNGRFAELKVFENNNFVVVIVSPLMKRILDNLKETSEVLFADSTGNVDTYGSKLFLLLTNSCCGGLPVCSIITTTEREDVLSCALDIFKTFLTHSSFGGKGLVGPKVIITDDSKSERNSFAKTFPNANILLCIFHVLQAAWRNVINKNIGVPLEKRQELFFKIKDMVNSNSEEDLFQIYNHLMDSPTACEFPEFTDYVSKLFDRRNEWAKCYRHGLILRGQHTNNLCESAMRVLKENILNRKKAYSTTQLFDYIVSDVEHYYETKLICVANGRPPAYLKKRLSVEKHKLDVLSSSKLKENVFKVWNKSTKQEYLIDSDIGVCSCPQGESGAICKHQIFILQKENEMKLTPVVFDPKQKALLLYLATGQKDISESWFAPLCSTSKEIAEQLHEEICIEPDINVVKVMQEENENCNTDSLPENANGKRKVITDAFHDCFKDIADKAESSTEILSAMENFVINYKKLKTENTLSSALNCFGKFSGFSRNKAKKITCQF